MFKVGGNLIYGHVLEVTVSLSNIAFVVGEMGSVGKKVVNSRGRKIDSATQQINARELLPPVFTTIMR